MLAYPSSALLLQSAPAGDGQTVLYLAIIIVMIALFGAAAELINRGTEKLEEVVGQGMAGGVILGFMSSLPELIFVLIAIGKGSTEVALGSAIGGNIILFTLGMGMVGITYFMKWRSPLRMKEDYRIEVFFLFIANLSLMALLVYGRLDAVSGVLLLAIYVAYLLYRYLKVHERVVTHARTREGRRLIMHGAAYFTVGIAVVVLLSDEFIKYILAVSGALGISALFLSIVITPIAADLPEQLSAYRLSVSSRGGGSTALVGFIGSKLQNNTVLLGAIGLLSATAVKTSAAFTEFALVIIINFIAIAAIYHGRLTRRNGMVLVLLYFVAIASAFTL